MGGWACEVVVYWLVYVCVCLHVCMYVCVLLCLCGVCKQTHGHKIYFFIPACLK
jgi:hypothetical protein